MQAYSIEQSIMEGKIEVNDLFEFVRKNAETFDAYNIERAISPFAHFKTQFGEFHQT